MQRFVKEQALPVSTRSSPSEATAAEASEPAATTPTAEPKPARKAAKRSTKKSAPADLSLFRGASSIPKSSHSSR
mgnify:CR=1 FL=1